MENESAVLNQSENDSIRNLLEENNRLLREVHVSNERLERYLRWNRIWSILRLLIILAPIIAGIIFLKPYVQNAFSTYQELLGDTSIKSPNQPFDVLDGLRKYQQVDN